MEPKEFLNERSLQFSVGTEKVFHKLLLKSTACGPCIVAINTITTPSSVFTNVKYNMAISRIIGGNNAETDK